MINYSLKNKFSAVQFCRPFFLVYIVDMPYFTAVLLADDVFIQLRSTSIKIASPLAKKHIFSSLISMWAIPASCSSISAVTTRCVKIAMVDFACLQESGPMYFVYVKQCYRIHHNERTYMEEGASVVEDSGGAEGVHGEVAGGLDDLSARGLELLEQRCSSKKYCFCNAVTVYIMDWSCIFFVRYNYITAFRYISST